jgi:hypothetical protein
MAAEYLSKSKTLTALVLLAGLGQTFAAKSLPEVVNSDATDNYDQVIAHIPYSRAVIASAALAELNIILYKAKTSAEQILCHGHWSPSGEALQQVGPLAVKQRAARKVWLYQSLRRAHPLACDGVSRAQYFLEMSRHLPAWVSIRPAGQTSAFNQGLVQPLPPAYFAER